MAIKINIGVCKKIGLPEYGSAGSHCDIELEMDFAAMQNPDEFQKRVAFAYRLCRDAVESELATHRPNGTPKQDTRPMVAPSTEYRNSPPPERNDNQRNDNRFPVSAKQMAFINQLTKAVKGLNARKLDTYCQQTYGAVCNQLTSKDASRLIDDLKQAKDGGKEIAS